MGTVGDRGQSGRRGGQFARARQHGVPFIGYVGLSIPSFETAFTPLSEVAAALLTRLVKAQFSQLPLRRNRLASRKGTLGLGYASEAATASLRFAFEKLTLQQIVAFTVPLNKRSIRVMERTDDTRTRG